MVYSTLMVGRQGSSEKARLAFEGQAINKGRAKSGPIPTFAALCSIHIA